MMFHLSRYLIASVCKPITVRLPEIPRVHSTISNSPTNIKNTTSSPDNISKKNTEDKKTSSSCIPKIINGASNRRGSINVAIIGGGMAPIYTGLLLKQSPIIKLLHIVDTKDTLAGAILDMGHIDTSIKIKHFKSNYIMEALKNMDIIALMDETDFDMGRAGPLAQFMVTSTYVKRMAEKMIKACPTALVAIFARPVTSSLAMVSELYKRAGWWDPDRIIGSIAIDCMRIEAMAAQLLDLNPAYFSVPIVGGADPCTVVPLLSHAKPINLFTKDQESMLIRRLRSADKELASSELKGPKISSGAAAAKLIVSLAGGLSGYKNIISCAFVRSNVLPVCRFYASELEFGPNGVQKNYGLPKVSQRELSLIEESIPLINEYVSAAINNLHDEKEEKIKV